MPDSQPTRDIWIDAGSDELDAQVILRRPVADSADLDITPMIDITFLLLIFFLVCSTAAMQQSVELPSAEYGKGVSQKQATIITMAGREGPGLALVYLGDGTAGIQLPDVADAQDDAIREEVEKGLADGKDQVLLKAEKEIKVSEIMRVSGAIGQVEGASLHLAVMEEN